MKESEESGKFQYLFPGVCEFYKELEEETNKEIVEIAEECS